MRWRDALLCAVLLTGCPAPLEDPPEAAPGAGPDWETGYTPRGKLAESVMVDGYAGEPAADVFFAGSTIAGFSTEVLAHPDTLAALDGLLAACDSVQIVVPWYQDDASSSGFARHPDKTPSDASLRTLIQAAHDGGADVLLSPWVDARDGSWRGTFQPADREAWFADLEQLVAHYAALAEEEGVSLLSLGSEYNRLDRSEEARWRAVAAVARAEFGGGLTYGANWNDAATGGDWRAIEFWDALDFVGIDAYFPLASPANEAPTTAQLVANWAPHLNRIAQWRQSHGEPPVLPEIRDASGLLVARSAVFERGAEVPPAVWEALGKLAVRCLVPVDARLRLVGAGAGLVDRD